MNKIKIMWLGQAGLLFEKKDIKIIVDIEQSPTE